MYQLVALFLCIHEGYADEDLFNADETGILFRLTPDRTLKFKGEKCVGGKLSKERITALVCANADGSEKRKLPVIGNLFEAELSSWNREHPTRKRKIILLVDNCPAHPVLLNLENIKLVFLPANTTSILQPTDQGVIRRLKYTLLDAIRFIEKARRQVTTKTIQSCFRHVGILSTQGLNGTENEDDNNNDDDLPLTEWLRKANCNELEDAEEENEEGGEEYSEVATPYCE
ncbi:hypothetical protein PR048_033486 [Dryococelus australis]|uniref:DDE-1 domain-containing protein n=1 Tax=Dryococelus australis TaxID=614101 RepID=A0ABQ9G3I1_9NEOP|nr:hypothetical protein PR048_033486 [Dryococelus australis]